MDNIFNFNRFIQLFIRHTLVHYRTYLMSFVVLMGVLALTMGYVFYLNKGYINSNAQFVYFVTFLLLGGSIFTSVIFSELNDKCKAIPYLMLPASVFEKFLLSWIYSFVIFQLVYIIGFYLIDYLLLAFSERINPPVPLSNSNQQEALPYALTFLAFMVLHSLTFFGAVFFKKLHFIKTGFALFILLGLLVLANSFFLESLTGAELSVAIPFQGIEFIQGEAHYYIPSVDQGNMYYYLMAGLALLLWLGTYFKLKEQEV